MQYVGKRLPRQDGYAKVTGKATFSHDVSLPGMLYGKVLRSPYPHAKILAIDVSKAAALPGVKAIATWENTPRVLFNTSATMTFTSPHQEPVLDQYIFDNVVRYVGDEVAAVAATSEAIAAEAVKRIQVTYEELPYVLDPLEAMEEAAPEIHPCQAGKNIPGEVVRLGMGDFHSGFAQSDVTFSGMVKVPIQKQAQMETHAAVAQWQPDGGLTVWSTTQTPHPSKMILAHVFGMPQSKVRVANPPYVGGGFGVRIGLSAKAEPIAAVLAKLSGQPVKVVYDRHEDFTASDTRHGGYLWVKLGAKKDGTFQALELRAALNTGAYCSFGVETVGVAGAMGISVYRVPHISFEGHSVYTNIVPAGAMRGFGNPQAMFAVELAVDNIAKQLGRDPADLRQQNIMQVGDAWCLPYSCSSTGLAECIDKVCASIGWAEKRGKKQEGTLRRGVGIGVGTHVSNSWPFCVDYDNVYLRVEQDGSLHLATGAPDIGTGTTTSLLQVAADAVGVPYSQVAMTFGDTQSTPFDIGSHASRTLYAVGHAIVEAAETLRKDILSYAAEVLEVPGENLQLAEGIISGSGKETSLADIAYHAHLRNKQFVVAGRSIPPNAPPWHAHAAEVEVDMATGMVRVLKIAAAHDVGKAINPTIVEGQIEGGVVMGVGYATREEITYDEKGRPYNDGFHKYMLPTADDIPEIDAILIESCDPTGPFGAKGVGECGLVPTAAAIASAVEDAIGIRFTEIPLTPVRVLKGIKNS